AMYRTVSNDFAPAEPFDYDMLVFFSPAGIDSLFKNFPDFKQENIVIATFGPTTTKAARDAGLNVQIEAPAPDAPSMPAAIGNFLSAHQERADEGAPTV
ncbi:MAG: uroporphyrinogen-III synthase, partial [Muribaculaceae bacterium]|nr:uroporphyrinogen-III synthase [Muribaculaceae bacterium]